MRTLSLYINKIKFKTYLGVAGCTEYGSAVDMGGPPLEVAAETGRGVPGGAA